MKSAAEISNEIDTACKLHIKALHLPDGFMQVVQKIYLPLAERLLQNLQQQPMLISVNGAQGTGKSTLTSFLKIIMQTKLNQPVAEFSLDDFYATYQQRLKLAGDIHPLLQTRGVPGTHDLDLLEDVIDSLSQCRTTAIPRFNKAADDRHAPDFWQSCTEPVRVILFEGWCNHSPVQSSHDLQHPVNELEATEDPDGIWRNYANEQLAEYHRRVFSRADSCVMLKSPDFESVYQWRSLQEEKLWKATPSDQSHRLMDKPALKRFIQHYERITRHTLAQLPEKADILLPVNPDHSIADIVDRHDST